jgi:Transposase zinc-ribbon domain
MPETMLATLSNIRTVEEMIVAFRDEEHCRRLLEGMVWPDGRICPACGYKRSIALAVAIRASGVRDRVFINVPMAIAGSSSR